MNMMSFAITHVLPALQSLASSRSFEQLMGDGGSSESMDQAMAMLMQYSQYVSGSGGGGGRPSDNFFQITTFFDFMPIGVLIIPIVEFFAAVVCLQMYRESFLNLLGCGACYRSDKGGSVRRRAAATTFKFASLVLQLWNIIPDRFRSIYPLEALRWANPAMVAQGLVPPAPPGIANNGQMAAVFTSKSGTMVETL